MQRCEAIIESKVKALAVRLAGVNLVRQGIFRGGLSVGA